MVNKCCVVACTSNYNGGKVVPVFVFPKDDDLRKLWVRFVNRNFWTVTKSSVICLKHFYENLIHKGASAKRFRLLYNLKPVPTIYPASIATASLPVMSVPRKSPTKRIFQEDEYQKFLSNDVIEDLNSLTVADSPTGYSFSKFDDCVVFHKIIQNKLHIPQVAECIRIDKNLHVKLFYKNLPVSLPPWFRVTHQCVLKRRSMLENFNSHFSIEKEKLSSILEELKSHQVKKN
ncbi:uncharacterized protein LOC136096677 [Hydra vulgaris]|uniref:uncharacterized protein LOC136096677 n=1 Tax=Hydra vulgaris TaxID=6087 RepID=UPI0032EA5B98